MVSNKGGNMEDIHNNAYWAGFTTMLAIVGLIVMLHIGIKLDNRQREQIEETQITEVI